MIVVDFNKPCLFQEYRITGILDRKITDYREVSLTCTNDPENVSISCVLSSDCDDVELEMGQVIRARLALEPKIECPYGAPPSFEIEAIERGDKNANEFVNLPKAEVLKI